MSSGYIRDPITGMSLYKFVAWVNVDARGASYRNSDGKIVYANSISESQRKNISMNLGLLGQNDNNTNRCNRSSSPTTMLRLSSNGGNYSSGGMSMCMQPSGYAFISGTSSMSKIPGRG